MKTYRPFSGFIALGLMILLAFTSVSANTGDGPREWTNAKGQKILAEMIGFRTAAGWEYVSIRRSDGREFEILVEDLIPSDQEYARANRGKFTVSADLAGGTPMASLTTFEKSAREHLVKFDGRGLDDWEGDGQPEYYAIYFSAGWCGPCRRFTPSLVEFYENYHEKHKNFEVIFVSSDRSEDDMEGYMKEAGMPWPALDFSKKQRVRELTRYSESGIPNLVVVDRDGKVLSKSYVNGKYEGPSKVLADLENFVKGG